MKAWVIRHPEKKKKFWDSLESTWDSLCYATLCRTREDVEVMMSWDWPVGIPTKVDIQEVK